MRIDLHIHTNKSDGELSPKEVIEEASKNGVYLISIADHDTTEAYNDELFEFAKRKNVKLINGVEISTKIEKTGIHVLGYNYDLNNENFKRKLYEIRNSRHIYLKKVSKSRIGIIIKNKGEFIETIMNENCPAYVKKETVTPKEAAKIIREAGRKSSFSSSCCIYP